MTKADIYRILEAAKAPGYLAGKKFGDWEIIEQPLPEQLHSEYGRTNFLSLIQRIEVEPSWDNIHKIDDNGKMIDVVMEDSPSELKKHLPIFMHGCGHVLKTGLGLGCVVRGLLAKESIEKISVIEIDQNVIDVIGQEFADNPRVDIYHGDALTFDASVLGHIDFAWHDIWTPENQGLQGLHAKLITKYFSEDTTQGAWAFPRCFKRLLSERMEFIG